MNMQDCTKLLGTWKIKNPVEFEKYWNDLSDLVPLRCHTGQKIIVREGNNVIQLREILLASELMYGDIKPNTVKRYSKELGKWMILGEEPREKETKKTVEEEAVEIIYGDRENTYGDPAKNIRKVAALWSAYLGLGEPLIIEDVCNLMILLKTARLQHTPDHRDSMVDIVGYTLLKERIQNE
jgi:hypothetical protein